MNISIVIIIFVILFLLWISGAKSAEKTTNSNTDQSHPCSCGCAQTGVCTCNGCGCGCASPQKKSCQTWHPHNHPQYFDDYPAGSGFGLSSGEIHYQLPHPHDAHGPADNLRLMQIAANQKAYHHKGGFELSCGDVHRQAAAWPAYVWQQPAPITNYFNEPYPEDTMSDGANMEYNSSGPSFNPNHGYNTPEYALTEIFIP